MKKLLLLLFLSFFSTQGFAASCPDGSEPIQTVSADGSYYIYKCGNTKNEQTSSNNEQTSSSANEDTIVVQNITPPKDNCSETKKKRVTTEEYLSESKSFIVLKNYMIDISLQNAFQQVNGSEIRNFQSLALSSENGIENENFSETSYSKYEGLIDSYDVVSQEVQDLGGDVKVLTIVVDATVCVKDKNELTKDTLIVGDFTYNNSTCPALKSVMEEVFSKQSKSFETTYGNPRDTYHDILITGRIDKITTVKVVDKKATEAARIAAQKKKDEEGADIMLFSLLSAVSKKRANNNSGDVLDDFSKTAQELKQQQGELKMPEIYNSVETISVSITAKLKNKKIYTTTAESERKISGSSDKCSIVINAVKKASEDLFIKLR